MQTQPVLITSVIGTGFSFEKYAEETSPKETTGIGPTRTKRARSIESSQAGSAKTAAQGRGWNRSACGNRGIVQNTQGRWVFTLGVWVARAGKAFAAAA